MAEPEREQGWQSLKQEHVHEILVFGSILFVFVFLQSHTARTKATQWLNRNLIVNAKDARSAIPTIPGDQRILAPSSAQGARLVATTIFRMVAICAIGAWSTKRLSKMLMVRAKQKHWAKQKTTDLAKGQQVKRRAQIMAFFTEMAGFAILKSEAMNMWEKDSMIMDLQVSMAM